MTSKTNTARRNFLKKLAFATAGSSLFAYQNKLNLIQSALAATNFAAITGYKSLVCVFLHGGNDAFNMFIPFEAGAYSNYASIRQNLAIAHDQLLPISSNQYGFHPSMPRIRDLYNQGKIGLVSNVGNLFEPTTRAGIIAGTANLPPDLFSHNHQQEIWQTNKSPAANTSHPGWGGLMADILAASNTNPDVPLTYSTTGNNLWQVGQVIQPVSIDPWEGATDFSYLSADETWPPWQQGRANAWKALLNLSSPHLLESQAAANQLAAERRTGVLQAALALSEGQILTPYNPENYLAAQLRMVARLIYARQQLGQTRQIFFVGADGWDTHGTQLPSHAALLGGVDEALFSFQQTMQELSVADSVTTFTASEFGRTLTSNGDGTDHAWGSHCMVMGDAVAGGSIHGTLPTLELDGPDDAGDDGRIIPTIAVDQYGATLAKWMGLSNAELTQIFPNLSNFSEWDLGFMN